MKTFKLYTLKLFPLLFLLLAFSCSEKSVTDTGDIVQLKNNVSPDLLDYLEITYPQGYTFGFERTFEENNDTFIVREVFPQGETLISAFVVLTNNNFSQFLELDRTRELVLIDDFNDLDFYEINVSNTELKNIFDSDFLEIYIPPIESGGRFWGWSCGSEYTIPGEGCHRTCAYYVLGRAVTQSDDDGTFVSKPFPCNDLPGKNPKLEN
ncbi:MAG: hypothetical protein RQ756_07510 [Flavobacteriaceae bacterium]|nr:hypothetical protein [Flavobacteriaceae bacterium]